MFFQSTIPYLLYKTMFLAKRKEKLIFLVFAVEKERFIWLETIICYRNTSCSIWYLSAFYCVWFTTIGNGNNPMWKKETLIYMKKVNHNKYECKSKTEEKSRVTGRIHQSFHLYVKCTTIANVVRTIHNFTKYRISYWDLLFHHPCYSF